MAKGITTSKNLWRIFKRRGRAFRNMAVRSNGEYDGSRWEKVKSYKDEASARAAFTKLEERDTWADGLKRYQYKLVAPGEAV